MNWIDSKDWRRSVPLYIRGMNTAYLMSHCAREEALEAGDTSVSSSEELVRSA